jgi:glutamate racemase
MSAADQPIGVFDSGIGGLTVMQRLAQELPSESIVYFGDTARVPYGSKSAETVRRYAREASAFLLSRDIKMLVIACNTATAHAEDVLRASLPVPVLGVIEPGARAAVQATRTGRIGVVGTAGTIGSGAYDIAVRRKLPDARVYAQPCPLFVPLVEEGWAEHPTARLVAAEYLSPLVDMDVDVLILGCTHYPLMRPLLAEVMGPAVTLVDSAEETAQDVHALLTEKKLLRTSALPPRYTFVASDSPLRFRDVGRRLVGDLISAVEQVDVEGYGQAA